MDKSEKLVKKAATECSVCNEALADVIKKRVARGENIREVTRDLAQAITLEAGAQLFTPESLRNRYRRLEEKNVKAQRLGRNDPPQKIEKNGENESSGENCYFHEDATKVIEGGPEPVRIDDHFLTCNINDGNASADDLSDQEISARKVIHRAEVAVMCDDDMIRNNMINQALKMAKEVPHLDLADELNEAIDAAIFAIDLAIKVNKVLGAISDEMVATKVKRLYNNANGNSCESL